MKSLKGFLYRHVTITAVNGKRFSGEVVEYIYPEDNDSQMESTIVEDVISCILVNDVTPKSKK